MNLRTNNLKYLVLQTDGCPKHGLDHSLAVLKGAIKEAIYLGRTLVINKFSMASIHNLGHPAENLEYKKYINLDKTQVYEAEQNGSLQQISSRFHYINAENFNLNEYSEKNILLMDNDIRSITEEENNQYEVIIRKTSDFNYVTQFHNILVSFYPSDKVEYLTDVVLKTLGTSLDTVKRRSLVYQSIDYSTNGDIFYKETPNTPLYYAAMHIRINEIYRTPLYNRYWNRPRHLKHIIKRVKLPFKGCIIYIMSDTPDPRYFDFLKKDHIVYRYFDIPELEALVSKNNGCGIDNAMLYSVEKNILQYAYIKIIRAKSAPKILYTNSSFNIPLLSVPSKYLLLKYQCRRYSRRTYITLKTYVRMLLHD